MQTVFFLARVFASTHNACGLNFLHIQNMASSDFLSLMSVADVMVGNSSAAIREAPSFFLPAVNIGTRQQGRLRAANGIDVVHNEKQITKAIKKALFDKDFISIFSYIILAILWLINNTTQIFIRKCGINHTWNFYQLINK